VKEESFGFFQAEDSIKLNNISDGYVSRNDSVIVWAGPPIDGSTTDDWSAINTIVQAAPYGSTVKLRKSTLPYICNHTIIAARSNITLDLNGNIVLILR
jgi:hypothetical protein